MNLVVEDNVGLLLPLQKSKFIHLLFILEPLQKLCELHVSNSWVPIRSSTDTLIILGLPRLSQLPFQIFFNELEHPGSLDSFKLPIECQGSFQAFLESLHHQCGAYLLLKDVTS